ILGLNSFEADTKRKRRHANNVNITLEEEYALLEVERAFTSLLTTLDPHSCLPLALCAAATVAHGAPNNLTEAERAVLQTIGYTGSVSPVQLSELSTPNGHIRYALMAGSVLHNPEDCTKVVPECPLTP
ncbi:unnamed protein product, partial [Meganyctiphanes norvegica]